MSRNHGVPDAGVAKLAVLTLGIACAAALLLIGGCGPSDQATPERKGGAVSDTDNEWTFEVEAMSGVERDKSYKEHSGWARFRHAQYSGRVAAIVRDLGAILTSPCDLPAGTYTVTATVRDDGSGRPNAMTVAIGDQTATLQWHGDEAGVRDISTDIEIARPANTLSLESAKRRQKYLVVDKITLHRE